MNCAKPRQKIIRKLVAVVVSSAIIASWPLAAAAELPGEYQIADLKALQRAFVGLAEKVQPNVVAIRTYKAGNPQTPSESFVLRPYSQGSGFVIASDGYIVTNRHVLEDADVVTVVVDSGIKYDAKVVQTDPRSDLAVLKIDAEGLSPIQFGDLSGLRVNQWVFACGNPFGLANDDGRTSITYGVVSALGRQMTRRLVGESEIQYYGNMIETSATINPGGSGGPLFDLDGKVVGIVAAIETSSGVSEGHGYAIPVDKNVRRILETLRAGELVRYGFFGIKVQDVDPPRSALVASVRNNRGAEVHSISIPNGPAQQAGLKAEDVLIKYDGVAVRDSDHLVRLIGFTPVGSEVSVTYLRHGVKRRAVVKVGDRHEILSRAGIAR